MIHVVVVTVLKIINCFKKKSRGKNRSLLKPENLPPGYFSFFIAEELSLLSGSFVTDAIHSDAWDSTSPNLVKYRFPSYY